MPQAVSQRMVAYGRTVIYYELERKRVKNLNLRIRRDGSVYVSAHPRLALKTIDAFVSRRGEFILSAQERFRREAGQNAALPAVPRPDCLARFTQVTAALLPRLAAYRVPMPQVRLREMKSRWGSCAYKRGVITLNTRLYHAPGECLEYVVLHELCHFVHPDHSPAFHALLGSLMPDYRARKAALEQWSGGWAQ